MFQFRDGAKFGFRFARHVLDEFSSFVAVGTDILRGA